VQVAYKNATAVAFNSV